jgi:excisionase family DNA binding protein
MHLQLDPVALEPFIRRVVEETLRVAADRAAPGTGTCSRPEPDQTVLLMKPPDAARALAISERKLWELTRGGEIPYVPIGRAVRYDATDLRAWVEGRKRRGGAKETDDGEHIS